MSVTMPNVERDLDRQDPRGDAGGRAGPGRYSGQHCHRGRETTLPFLHFEGEMPNKPVVAVEVLDRKPEDWSRSVVQAWGDAVGDPGEPGPPGPRRRGAELIALTLDSAHPERGQHRGG